MKKKNKQIRYLIIQGFTLDANSTLSPIIYENDTPFLIVLIYLDAEFALITCNKISQAFFAENSFCLQIPLEAYSVLNPLLLKTCCHIGSYWHLCFMSQRQHNISGAFIETNAVLKGYTQEVSLTKMSMLAEEPIQRSWILHWSIRSTSGLS